MILQEIMDKIEKDKGDSNFIYPYYKKYCFSNIPSTILEFFHIKKKRKNLLSKIINDNLAIEDVSKVVFFLFDGLGYNLWREYLEKFDFFYNFNKKGIVMPLTSVFPSTTAATLTTINSGLTPQEHGLPEWVTYFKEIDMIVNTLPFSPLGGNGRDDLLKIGISPKILFKGETIYQILEKSGVRSFSFINESYANSAYSRLVHRGSIKVPFNFPRDLAVKLRRSIKEEDGPTYSYVYLDDVDYAGHKYGPHTEEFIDEISSFSNFFKKFLDGMDQETAKETIILIAADHGILNVSPNQTIYLNKFQELVDSFQISEIGNIIHPTGSPRDIFLHIREDKLEKMFDFLSKKFKDKAQILRTEEAIKMNLFGTGEPIEEFYDRIGNLLILPYGNNTIWYEHIEGKKFEALGHHGGLSREEMLIPFAIANLSDLIN